MVMELARQDGSLAVWWGSLVECQSALARLCRDGLLSLQGSEEAKKVLVDLTASWAEITPGENIRNIAGRLLFTHPLRASDSLQLAAAILWAEQNPKGHPFVCFDQRLRDAARKEGFDVLPAETAVL